MKVLKFGADWCPGCLIMKPRWQEIESENPGLETEFIDGDQNPELLEKWQVKELPEFIFLDSQGVEITRMKGVVSKKLLLKKIAEYHQR
jgi:thiol-disulfide isomerase/thioredoxin